MSDSVGCFLWTVPRSCSTAVFRSVESHPSTRLALFEPFSQAFYFGEERVSDRYADKSPDSGCRFKQVKERLERELQADTDPNRNLVFIKDMAYHVVDSGYPPGDLIPASYRHVILVRHPRRSVESLYRLSAEEKHVGWNYFDKREAGFEQLWWLYELLRDSGNQILVIDADDLLKNPELHLRAFCDHTGVPFSDSLLRWKPAANSAVFVEANWSSGWFHSVLANDRFVSEAKKTEKVEHTVAESDAKSLPEDVERCIAGCMEYYEKFQALKFRP